MLAILCEMVGKQCNCAESAKRHEWPNIELKKKKGKTQQQEGAMVRKLSPGLQKSKISTPYHLPRRFRRPYPVLGFLKIIKTGLILFMSPLFYCGHV